MGGFAPVCSYVRLPSVPTAGRSVASRRLRKSRGYARRLDGYHAKGVELRNMRTVTALLVSERLGRDVVDLINEERDRGQSWRRISLIIRDATGVDVSYESVRAWATAAQHQAGAA